MQLTCNFQESSFIFAFIIEHESKTIIQIMEKVIRMKPEYVKAIVDNPALMGNIAQSTNKSISTIERWCASNDSRLTMLSVLNCVRDYLKLSKDSSITEHVKQAA